jgi:nicotinate-nucleotide adenylyltransferase
VTTSDHLIAVYGGTFDPVHCGHITIARRLIELFSLDEFIFLPAFHAPHKPDRPPTSAYHRFAMLTLATAGESRMSISTLELDHGTKRYTVESLREILDMYKGSKVFFVMGADSWRDITTWRDWENVLLMTDHIVVTRPGYDIEVDHVTDVVRERIVDLRGSSVPDFEGRHIYISDAVQVDVSATDIRDDIKEDERLHREDDVPEEVAKYIEKYELYK